MRRPTTYPRGLLLLPILVLAAALRLYDLGSVPLVNDELSALNRLRYENFSELVEKGITPDGHPAGVQTFLYYWTALFGQGEWVVRLPFLLMGLLAIVVAYALARRWFNETVGLWTAACLAVLQYPIFYTTIARPYASGLLFCLAMAWYWTRLLFDEDSNKTAPAIGYALAGLLCAYNHYFSLLFAGIVALTGLFFLTKKDFKPYLFAHVAIALLYLPHVPIFFAQLSTGGIGGWLAPPEADFVPRYLSYILHFSPLMWATFLAAVAIGLMLREAGTPAQKRFRRIAIAWFLIPLSVGMLYSLLVAPVLHQGVLFFSFPFLLIFLFSFYPELSFRNQSMILLFLGIGTGSLIVERQHFDLMRNRGVEMIVHKSLAWADQVGKSNYTPTFNVNGDWYVRYYYEKYGDSLAAPIYSLEDKQDLHRFREIVSAQRGHYFSLGWTSRNTPLEYLGIIREQYPYLVDHKSAFISEFYCFSRTPDSTGQNQAIYHSRNDFEHAQAFWANNEAHLTSDTVHRGRMAVRMDPNQAYGPTFSRPLQELLTSRHDLLLVSVAARLPDSLSNPQLVVSIVADTGAVFWQGLPLREQLAGSMAWGDVHVGMRMRDIDLNRPDLRLSVYVWNPGQARFYLDDFEVLTLPGNPYLYGLAEPLDKER